MYSHDALVEKLDSQGVIVTNDGLEIKLLVPLRGVEGDLITGTKNEPLFVQTSDSHQRSLHNNDIMPSSNVKAKDIDYVALRVAEHKEGVNLRFTASLRDSGSVRTVWDLLAADG